MKKEMLKKLTTLIGGYAFKSSKYVNNGIRIIRIANVQDGYISDESPCFYPLSYINELGEANLESGDLLMSLTGNVGRVAFINDELLPAGLNQRVECIRTNDLILKRYLYYFFQSDIFKQDAIKNSTGIAQLNMSTIWLGNYMIPLYDHIKMQSIIHEFDTINEIITKDKAQLKLFDELIKSRFISQT